GALGIARTLRKYDGHRSPREEHRRTIVAVLDEVRATLAKSPSKEAPKTLLGRFTFADIAVAQVLAFANPPERGVKLGKASRRSFADPELAKQYADLAAWRDELYRVYREARPM